MSNTPQQPTDTSLESLEDIQRALQQAGYTPTGQLPIAGPAPAGYTPTKKEQQLPVPSDATPFRPLRRPPMALLCVLDDASADGEWIRIRTERITIGRTTGEVLIPHETMMSGKHAEIYRQVVSGAWRWLLRDLESTNGTFVRAAEAALRHGAEFLAGGNRYKLDASPQGVAPAAAQTPQTAAAAPQQPGTSAWQNVAAEEVLPSIVQVNPQGPGKRYFLNAAENWIGRDATCQIHVADPLLSPRHARIYKDAKGSWRLANSGSLNGVWVRIQQLAIDKSSMFQLGEQRFLLRIL